MKTIVITGATSGIGRALAEYFLKAGCKVLAGYRDESFAKELQNLGAVPFYIEMKDPNSIRRAATYIKSCVNKIDTLINAAGCVVAGPVEFLDVNKIKEQFEVNTFSHLELTQELLDLLENGKVINISSIASFGYFPFIAPYCASKRALDILFSSMFNETKRNIKVVSVKPGVIATPLWDKSIENNKLSLQNIKSYDKEISFLIKNAKKNATHGLPVSEVVKCIAKIDKLKNPKTSYTIGVDAKFAEFVSFFPQNWISSLIRFIYKLKLFTNKQF